MITYVLLYLLGAPWLSVLQFPLPGWLHWLGFAIGILSVIFWTWTQVHLDTQWSAQLQLTRGHHLVTSGPYARIRHPLYAALFGWCIAVVLLTANWVFLGLCALSILGILFRVPREEQMMIETFGSEYTAYMQRTGRFLSKL